MCCLWQQIEVHSNHLMRSLRSQPDFEPVVWKNSIWTMVLRCLFGKDFWVFRMTQDRKRGSFNGSRAFKSSRGQYSRKAVYPSVIVKYINPPTSDSSCCKLANILWIADFSRFPRKLCGTFDPYAGPERDLPLCSRVNFQTMSSYIGRCYTAKKDISRLGKITTYPQNFACEALSL